MSRRVWCLAATLAVLVGCHSDEPVTVEWSDTDSLAFEVIRQVDFGVVADAFEALARQDYTTTIVTEEVNENNEVIASSRHVVSLIDGLTRVLESATQGRSTSSFASTDEAEVADAASDLSFEQTLVSREPAFAARKTREQFRYNVVGDTVVNGEPARLIEVVTIRDEQKQPVRRARLAVSSNDRLLQYLRIDRSDKSFFYHEQSQLEIEMRRTASGVLPSRRSVSVRVDLPFRPPRRFVSSRTYEVDEVTSDSTLAR